MNRNIHNLDRYDYELDKKFISSYPLEKRENSKLLVYRDNKIVDSNFKNISDHLPKNSTLFFNCLLYTSPSPRDRQKSSIPAYS